MRRHRDGGARVEVEEMVPEERRVRDEERVRVDKDGLFDRWREDLMDEEFHQSG